MMRCTHEHMNRGEERDEEGGRGEKGGGGGGGEVNDLVDEVRHVCRHFPGVLPKYLRVQTK